MKNKRNHQCRLCQEYYKYDELSEEHYPAKSVGNDDIVKINLVELYDSVISLDVLNHPSRTGKNYKTLEEISNDYFDDVLAEDIFPKGRTSRTLCRDCNTFLGKYDEAYKLFFDNDGNPSIIKGYAVTTKIKIIKALYAKFLSVPECSEYDFDFLNFIRDKNQNNYEGEWGLYCVRRDFTSDILGFGDLETDKMEWDEGVIFEISDEKFVYHLMNFEPHKEHRTMEMWNILKKNYSLVYGNDVPNGYNAQMRMVRFFKNNFEDI